MTHIFELALRLSRIRIIWVGSIRSASICSSILLSPVLRSGLLLALGRSNCSHWFRSIASSSRMRLLTSGSLVYWLLSVMMVIIRVVLLLSTCDQIRRGHLLLLLSDTRYMEVCSNWLAWPVRSCGCLTRGGGHCLALQVTISSIIYNQWTGSILWREVCRGGCRGGICHFINILKFSG